MLARKEKQPVGFTVRHLILLGGGDSVVSQACGLARCQWSDIIPTKHVLTMEKLTGLPIATLRPDLCLPESDAQVSTPAQVTGAVA